MSNRQKIFSGANPQNEMGGIAPALVGWYIEKCDHMFFSIFLHFSA